MLILCLTNIKPKKCKGTGIAKGYGCGEMATFRTYGLCQNKCYPKWLFNTPEGKEKVQKATLKATKDRRDLEKAEKQMKERKSLSYLLESTKNACHKYIRLRDKGKPCISCGNAWKPNFQAGHFYKAELYSLLRFNEWNINGQCEQCNLRKEGNLNPYSVNLPKRIGQEKFKELKQIAEKQNLKVQYWDKEELKKTRKYYQTKIKEL